MNIKKTVRDDGKVVVTSFVDDFVEEFDLLFVDELTSEAYEKYDMEKIVIYSDRQRESTCGTRRTFPQVWGGHDFFGNRSTRWRVCDYLEKYLQRDNLEKLSLEYIFYQEDMISFPRRYDERTKVINEIINMVMNNETRLFKKDEIVEAGLYGYLMYVLSAEHLYDVAIDYLVHCSELGGINIFRDGAKEEIMEGIRKLRDDVLRNTEKI